ncbi:fibronectin type III domain-containing protein [uncultured Draconibacterium sp.]|uniref:golvesin C-terminal-like domain-containing protein n=1 Tax=uncultured Draconibacterium sp. TaxID=1573823 RepID=UPI00374929AA
MFDSYLSKKDLWRAFSLKTFVLLFLALVIIQQKAVGQETTSIKDKINELLKGKTSAHFYVGADNYLNGKKVLLDTIFWNAANDTLHLHFNKALAEMPFRENDEENVSRFIREHLPDTLKKIELKIYANKVELHELVPNYYREASDRSEDRLSQCAQQNRTNVVRKKLPFTISSGLTHANIALWNSHGWYYEPSLDRWEWQRARLFTTVEDILPTAFVLGYIAPMLENAGANVFIPRERDWQINEVVVDNNASSGKSKFKKPRGKKFESTGFALRNQLYKNENPFELGTAIKFESTKKGNRATYIPEIPETGEYAVYVSYGKGEGKVKYRVHHSGSVTDFEVDQRMGFGTWIYLGKFHFRKGYDKRGSRVELIVPEGKMLLFSADAVRFGGGVGVVERNGKTGERAKFFEAARYYLQYAGAPDTLVWRLNTNDDYKDDYMSRGEWVNWLMGAPYGPTKNSQHPGLEIPMDMAFAFHTDAGILPGDGIVGTLGIYSTDRDTNVFAGGQSKYASRDLTDLIQTQIVDDINAIYKCRWTRRGMWNAQYSEAYRPQVPAMLLELLSHQNLNDVKYVLHPKFRFDVSRAIYKAMLRFIATQNGYDFIVQPLPVNKLVSEFTTENAVKLSWQPVVDELEPSAAPKKYMVYKRTGNNGFDNGTLVEKTEIVIPNLNKGQVYGFRVTAVNAGGESFPSEIVSVGIAENSKGNVLIVNGFDRVDSPEIFECDSLAGVLRNLDHGVAYHYDISTTGNQYDFDRKSPWLDDDSPGHGASYANLETTVFRGNTFDFSYQHGVSLLANNYSFVTVSDEAVEGNSVNLHKFMLVDLLYGEEKTRVFPGNDSTTHFKIYTSALLNVLEDYTKGGGNLLISGAYIGSEIPKNKDAEKRSGDIFGFKWRTNYAVKNGQFFSTSKAINFDGEFNTAYNLEQYAVEAPDGIEPIDDKGQTILRYAENKVSAGVFYNGNHKVVALGFPFETVKGESERNALMGEILELLSE